MNIYLIIDCHYEDDNRYCIRAKTMVEAIAICENKYLAGIKEDDPECDIEHEKEFYYEQILQSCSLVGQLKN